MVLRFVAGLLFGGIAVAGFFFVSTLGDNTSDPVAEPSSTTLASVTTTAATTTTTETPWVSAGEARFESTVLLPQAMSVDGGVARLEYDLISLGPVLAGDVFEDSTWVPVQPERWVLITDEGTFDSETRMGVDYARFEVPEEMTLAGITEVRLVGWRTVTPVEQVFEVPLVVGETVTLPDGASMTLTRVFEQSSGTLVSFDTRRSDGGFAAGPVEQYLEPVAGAGWRISWPESGFQVVKDDALIAPGSVWLRYTQSMWMPVAGDVVVWRGDGS